MPVLSNSMVKVLPVSSRSAMTLDEIREALAARPPVHASFAGGWASTDNHQSNLGGVGVAPPPSAPELIEAGAGFPRMIRARYYYWSLPPVAVLGQGVDGNSYRRLDALDVVITQAAVEQLSILVSSRNRQLVHRRDGALASLEAVLQEEDASVRIDRRASAVALRDADIFLWLAVKTRDNPQLSPSLRLDLVSGISGTDASHRTADLRAGVDFSRPNFLTAVAEADTLGPIELSFVRTDSEGRSAFGLKLHVDGGFEIHKSAVQYPNVLATEDLMQRASYDLAFSLIPEINALYQSDDDWTSRRFEVISSAMEELRARYESAYAALQERLSAAPGGSGPIE